MKDNRAVVEELPYLIAVDLNKIFNFFKSNLEIKSHFFNKFRIFGWKVEENHEAVSHHHHDDRIKFYRVDKFKFGCLVISNKIAIIFRNIE